MTNTYKYANQMMQLHKPDCPPTGLKTASGVAFRFQLQQQAQPQDFIPVAFDPIKPRAEGCCEGYALSMFGSIEQARQKRASAELRQTSKQREITGILLCAFIGELLLVASDGMMTPPGSSGHLSLYEFTTASLHQRVKAVHPC